MDPLLSSGIVSSLKVKKRETGLGLGMDEEIDTAGNKGWTSTVNSFNDVLAILKSTYVKNDSAEKKRSKTTKSIKVGIK